jgi:hypothetical protein
MGTSLEPGDSALPGSSNGRATAHEAAPLLTLTGTCIHVMETSGEFAAVTTDVHSQSRGQSSPGKGLVLRCSLGGPDRNTTNAHS